MGLPAALNWYVDGLRERSAIDVRCHVDGPESLKLPPEIARAIFRIVQECPDESVTPSPETYTAAVKLSRSADEITVVVSDQGKGISPEERAKIISGGSLGVGLRGMRERVGQLGGALDIPSTPAGTTITTRFPITQVSTLSGMMATLALSHAAPALIATSASHLPPITAATSSIITQDSTISPTFPPPRSQDYSSTPLR